MSDETTTPGPDETPQVPAGETVAPEAEVVTDVAAEDAQGPAVVSESVEQEARVAPPAPPAAPAPPTAPPAPPYAAPVTAPVADKSKVAAGILGILLGSLGIHKFYLGYTKEGVIMLLVSVLSFGFLAGVVSIIGLVEGILYLTKTDEEFYATYVTGKKAWF